MTVIQCYMKYNCDTRSLTVALPYVLSFTGLPLVEKIRDSAGQKGTGKWTAISALDYGQPVTLIGESVFARCLSSLTEERSAASKVLKGPKNTQYTGDKKKFLENIRQALYASKIVSYAQGFMLLREAAKVHGWNLNYGGIALMWRGGCIIRRLVHYFQRSIFKKICAWILTLQLFFSFETVFSWATSSLPLRKIPAL